jgi:uncharacterized protein YecE (DUF72 family)
MPQERLFRTGSPQAPRAGTDAWKLAARRRIRVGTASWTDKTLLEPGLFYPKEVKTPADRLRFYADVFPLVEVDASYYSLPSERNAKAWAERTPSGFVFNVKAFSLLTQHPARPAALPPDLREGLPESDKNVYLEKVPGAIVDEVWERFCRALRPLADAGRLGAVLFQFPEWFPPGPRNRAYILECRDRLASFLPDAWCAIEFRSAGWMSEPERQQRTLSFLEEQGLPYVCVDMPQGFRSSVPPVAAVTAPLAVVRFHGRRAETWGKRGVPVTERFRYEYSHEELAEWKPGVKRLAKDAKEVHVLMNNCYRDYAVRSAQTFTQMLLA